MAQERFTRSVLNYWPRLKEVNSTPQVGRGGSGQRCHGDFIPAPTRWSAGHPALHQPAEGQDPHLEEGKGVGKPYLLRAVTL